MYGEHFGGVPAQLAPKEKNERPKPICPGLERPFQPIDTLDSMKLPRGDKAVVDAGKVRDYCLNPSHPRGRHKARVFASALGITQADADFLYEELLAAAREGEATGGAGDEYGERYVVDFELARGERRAMVRNVWIVRRSERFPRLTSCFVLLD
jgi:hypothetical protein